MSLGYLVSLHFWWKRDRFVFFALSLILVPLLPLFYIRAIAPVVLAEQHLYLPSVGLSLLIGRMAVWAASRESNTRYVSCVLALMAIGSFSVMTVQRNRVWKDNLTLWGDAVRKSPESAFVHESLAGALLSHGRVDEAIEHYLMVLENDPTPSARTYNNIGIAYSAKGWREKAVRSFDRALEVRPDYAKAHVGRGGAFFEDGSMDEAITEFRRAIEIDPYLVEAYHDLSVAYARKGSRSEAEAARRQVLRLDLAY